jgi:hypothetical protein
LSMRNPESSVLSLRPNVARPEAVRAFQRRGLDTLYWHFLRGQLQTVAAVYVPFSLYRVEYDFQRARRSRIFALDCVEGVLDLFEFQHAPQPGELIRIESRNFLQTLLAPERAMELVREKTLRMIFQQGFFKVRPPRIRVERLPLEFSMPYWLGFYGEDGTLRCRAMDAVRRRMEGNKATALFEHWLAA